MRLYLSSYRIGNHAQKLLDLVGSGRRVGVIANALDNVPLEERIEYQRKSYDLHDVFKEMGLIPYEIDLRMFFGKKDSLKEELNKYDLIWAHGGNCFLLRRAMKYSGFDEIIKEILKKDQVVYGGFSAGICLLAPTLKGIELCDDVEQISEGYSPEIVWDGLDLIPYSIAPHYRSNHPESSMIENVVSYFDAHAIPYYGLRDGDVLIRNGSDLKLYKLEDGLPNPFDMDKEMRSSVSKIQPENKNSL